MEEYAISSENSIPLKDLVAFYGQTIGKQLPIKWSGKTYGTREVVVPWDKGEKLPIWKQKIGLVKGIKRMEKIEAP